MTDTIALSATSVPSSRDWVGLAWKSIAWGLLLGSIIYYVRRDALHYLFHYTPDSFKAFWSERILIRTHVACAVTMICTGSLQFWTGLRGAHFWREEKAKHSTCRFGIYVTDELQGLCECNKLL